MACAVPIGQANLQICAERDSLGLRGMGLGPRKRPRHPPFRPSQGDQACKNPTYLQMTKLTGLKGGGGSQVGHLSAFWVSWDAVATLAAA